MTQIRSCTERRQQLLALLEQDPANANARELCVDLEQVRGFTRGWCDLGFDWWGVSCCLWVQVLTVLRKKMRNLMAEHEAGGRNSTGPADGGGSGAGGIQYIDV
jgi:hypothetical protein